ncbi:hypothetical protein AVEN_14267-1 [Araneus ventricosus]|uniref:Uncharacterized protein n=1 Tax=Araneus ventricosus TaxID=182803 RepID=A0A4Y2KCT8_ARAVE|nr:hypothetical protein AVEN_14267-1 [Araneus ventricosus]
MLYWNSPIIPPIVDYIQLGVEEILQMLYWNSPIIHHIVDYTLVVAGREFYRCYWNCPIIPPIVDYTGVSRKESFTDALLELSHHPTNSRFSKVGYRTESFTDALMDCIIPNSRLYVGTGKIFYRCFTRTVPLSTNSRLYSW